MRSGLPPSLWLVGVPFALYAVGLAVVSALVPYAPALDDPEWLALARHFADTGTLDPEGLFRRVPLWQILLAASTSLLGDRSGVVLLQAASVLTVFVALAHRAREGRATVGSTAAVACVFALSPQALLYSRHAANELFVGALSVLVLVLAERARGRRAVAVGALVGCAAMTKLAAAALALPAVWLLRGRGDTGRRLAAFSAGVVLVVVPLASLALSQRGWPLDDTSAFNLSQLDQRVWAGYATPSERSAAALASFEQRWSASPARYLADAAVRGGDWLMRPGSLDLRYWLPGYPPLGVEVADVVVFFGVLVLAVLASTRSTLVYWLFPLVLWIACSFPQKTPYSPRVTALMPLLLLAPAGLDWLRRRR